MHGPGPPTIGVEKGLWDIQCGDAAVASLCALGVLLGLRFAGFWVLRV